MGRVWPDLFFDLRPNYDGGNEDNGYLLQKEAFGAPNPAAGHLHPMPLIETPGHSWASLGRLLWGHCSFLLGLVARAQGLVCALQESVSPVLCKFRWLYDGVNGDLLQEAYCHTQVCRTQSPCPCRRPLLTGTFTGNTQTQFCLSLCGLSGSWCAQGLF